MTDPKTPTIPSRLTRPPRAVAPATVAPQAPAAVAEVNAPVEMTAEQTSSSGDVQEFEIVSPVRKPKVVRVQLDSEDQFYAREWTARILFGMVKRVQRLIGLLARNGVLQLAPSGGSSSPDTRSDAERNLAALAGIGSVLAESEEDVFQVLAASVFKDAECKKAVEVEEMKDMLLPDLVKLGRAVWHVNWTAGALGKAVNGLVADSKQAVQTTS